MNGTGMEAAGFLAQMAESGSRSLRPEIVLFPPFTALPLLSVAAGEAGVELGGQDIFWEDRGAYTGEISPGMLLDSGASWFLAGHSERRHIIGEDDHVVRRKLEAGLGRGLKGILCVGELKEERESGGTEEVVRRQIESALVDLPGASVDNLVIAYEPVWAIGTGLTATPEEAERMHSLIREWISQIIDVSFADGIRIQYGGSVKPGNAAEILSKPSVNGALVGGASLKADSFMDIIRSAPGDI